MKKPLFALLSLVPLFAFATSYYWIGPNEGGELFDAANWDPTPTGTTDGKSGWFGGHKVYFTNDVPVQVKAKFSANGIWPQEVHVMGTNVTWGSSSNKPTIYFYGTGTSPLWEVAEGAVLTTWGSFGPWSGASTYRKCGKGVHQVKGTFNINTANTYCTVEDGTLFVDDSAFRPRTATVKSGATLKFAGTVSCSDMQGAITLETGATLVLTNASVAVKLVTGAGSVIGQDGASSRLKISNKPGTFTVQGKEVTYGPFTGTYSGNLYLGTAIGASDIFQIADSSFFADIRGICVPDGISFLPGIDTLEIPMVQGTDGGTLHLHDTEGNPLRIVTGIEDGANLGFDGGGDLVVTNTATINGGGYAATGTLSVQGRATLKLGDTTANADFNFAAGTPSAIRFAADSEILFNNATPADVTIPVVGDGRVTFNSPKLVTLRDFHKASTPVATSGRYSFDTKNDGLWELAGGEAGLPGQLTGAGGAKLSNRISGGTWYKQKHERVSSDPNRTVREPGYVEVWGDCGWFSISQTGGEFYSCGGSGLKNLFARGGRTYFSPEVWLCTGSYPYADGGRSQLVFDGGTVVVPRLSGSSAITLFGSSATTVAKTVIYVTDKGGRLQLQNDEPGVAPYFYCWVPFEVCTNTVTSGLLDIHHDGIIQHTVPMALNGPVRINGATLSVIADNVDATTKSATGTGLLTLRNATYDLGSGVSEAAIPGGLAYEGGALVQMKDAQTLSAASVDGADKGSLLVFYHPTDVSHFGADGGASFKVAGGLENDAGTGALKQPIFLATGNDQRYAEFAKYDAVKGLVPFDGYLTSLANADATKILKMNGDLVLADNATSSIGGLCFTHTSWLDVEIGSGAVLNVGNGTDPAAILLAVVGGIHGAGTLNFGGSEGLFYVPTSHQAEAPAVSAKIAGSNGIAFFCVNRTHDQKIALSGANTYTGGTRVWGVDLYAAHAQAFSSGDVYVTGGRMRGGRVILNREGATFANAFHLSGRGNSHAVDSESKYGRLYKNYRKGALSFAKNATVSGPVELMGETRITAADAVKGTISGVVSGDRLQVYKPFPTYDAGVLALTGANTYTGGTEVVSATLELAQGTSAGMGKVRLDNATLTFVNPSAVTFANAIEGAGRVRLCGAGVDFTGDVSDLTASKLELTGGVYDFTVAPPFATVENTTTGKAIVTLKAPGAYDLSGTSFVGKIQLNLEAGATLDLKGGTLNVYQFRGDRSAVNGTINSQIPDYPGLMILVK